LKSEQQHIEELKTILEKEHRRPFSLEEATMAFRALEIAVKSLVKLPKPSWEVIMKDISPSSHHDLPNNPAVWL